MVDRRRLGRQIVIYTKANGVYLGSAIGLGFWSKLDPVGQDAAVTFQSIRKAKRIVRNWKDKPDGIQYKQVCSDITEKNGTCFASIEACFRAGLPGWNSWNVRIKYIPPRRKRLSDKEEK